MINKEIKITSRIRKINGSLYLLLPKDIAAALNIKLNDLIQYQVTASTPIMVSYRCRICNYIFDMEANDIPYCPACNEETNLEVIEHND